MSEPQDGQREPQDDVPGAQNGLTVNLTVMNENRDPLAYNEGWTIRQYLQQAGVRVRHNQRVSLGGELAPRDRVVQPGQTIVVAPKLRMG